MISSAQTTPEPDAHTICCRLCGVMTHKICDWRLGYRIHKCSDCQLLLSDPLPTDEKLLEFYQGFLYRKSKDNELEAQVIRRSAELTEHFGWNETSRVGKTFLDHEGGTGVALEAARRAGCQCYFYQVDEQAIEFVKSRYGLDESCIFRSEAEIADRKMQFDFIVSDNVIEHVQDPAAYLRRTYAYLKPGGRIVIKTPCAFNTQMFFHPQISFFTYGRMASKYNSSLATVRMLTGRTWHCDPPRHIYSFTSRSMRRAATNASIPPEEVSIGHYRAPFWEYSLIARYTRPSKTLKGKALKIAALPAVGVELLVKMVQFVAASAGWLTDSGLICYVDKARRD